MSCDQEKELPMRGVTPIPRYTPEDLLHLPDRDLYELVDGQLREHTMNGWAAHVAGQVLAHLHEFSRTQKRGWVLPAGATYQCFPNALNDVRRVEVSFIHWARLTIEESMVEGHVRIPPDLAVRVLSPGDLAPESDAKVQQFLGAGTRLVWVVNPETQTVVVHRSPGMGTVLGEHDELDGEDVLPGFRCRVGDLFLNPEDAPPTS
jgi:Uma2 family endonuclease